MSLKISDNSIEQHLRQAWWSGVDSVNGYTLVYDYLKKEKLNDITHVLAVGKAASSMMLATDEFFDHKIKALLITKYDHVGAKLRGSAAIEVIESGHPTPDKSSLKAGRRAIDFVNHLNKDDHLLTLISGGASSLAESLKPGMTLDALQALNQTLLHQAAPIAKINSIRSDNSLIKKGKLLNRCKAASLTTLAISDVQGDDVMVIGSGIGACQLANFNAYVIGTNEVARNAISDYFSINDVQVQCNEESLYGDISEVAEQISNRLLNGENGAYIFGGEPVIELPTNPGFGGCNQSLAVEIALKIHNRDDISVLVAGSDGTDGPTKAAGGIVNTNTIIDDKTARNYLNNANANVYLKQVDSLFTTGPTGTNVMDLVVAIKY